jgi:hypothetical protein
MADKTELERFAQILMELVRDPAIREADRLTRGEIRGPSGQRWRAVMAENSPQAVLLELIPEIVDQTLFQLLDAIDNGAFPLVWRADDGSQTSLEDLGSAEMAGWLVGGEWPGHYSAERFHQYFSALRLDAEPEGA